MINNYYPLNHYKILSNVSLPEGKSPCFWYFGSDIAPTSCFRQDGASGGSDTHGPGGPGVGRGGDQPSQGGRCLDGYPLVN
jgi:hypothetical protein